MGNPISHIFRPPLDAESAAVPGKMEGLSLFRINPPQEPLAPVPAFQVDFPSGRFSFVMPGEGWRSYALKDISAAIYKAGRKSGLSKLERLHRFFDALTDKLYFTSEVEWNGGSGDV